MSNIVFIHKKNDKIKFNEFSKKIISSGTRSYCLSKIKKDFLIESIESADYLFVNTFREQIRGFAAVYHDNYDGKHLHISLICNAKTHRMGTRKNKNITKLAGKNIIEVVLKYGKQINVKDVRLDAIKEVIPYYYNLGFRFENSQNNTDTEKTLVKELQKAQTNNNKPTQKKALEKIVLKFYKGYFNEKMQHDMGKDTDERIKYAMDFGIPMKFVFKTTSICKGKSIKNPNRCRKYKTCKVVHGKKRSYCRTIKNTRKNQKGGKDKLFPSVETVFQDSLHKSIEKLFMSQNGNDYKLNSLDKDDYNDLVSLFKNGVEFRGKMVKPSPTYSYQDYNGRFINNFPRYNIVELLFTQNRDFSDFLQYLADNHPELFDKNNSTRILFMASQYLNPTTEKLIEILETKGILNDVLNPRDIKYNRRVVSPIVRLFNINNNINRFGFKKHRQPRIIELMKLFIDKGANEHDKDASGENTLLLASQQGYEQVVTYLLSINLDINSQAESNDYITPLYYAIRNNKKNVAEILIKHKDPNNSISIIELANQLENARYYNRDGIYELLEEEIDNRKIEGITDVVEKTTEKVGNKIDGEPLAEKIYSFLPDKSAVSEERKRAYYGGTKKGGRRTRKNKNTRKKSGGSNSDDVIPTAVPLHTPEAIPAATNVQPDMTRDPTSRQRQQLAEILKSKGINKSRKSYKGSRREKQRGGLSKPNISQFDYKSFVAEHKDNLINILLESVDKNKITKKYVASKEEFKDITQKINNYLLKNQKGGATPPTTPRGRIQPTIDPPNTSFTEEDFQTIHDIQQNIQQNIQQYILDGPYGNFQEMANEEPFNILNMDPLFNVACILLELLVLIEYNDTSYSVGFLPLFIISGFALHLQLNHRIGNWRENR